MLLFVRQETHGGERPPPGRLQRMVRRGGRRFCLTQQQRKPALPLGRVAAEPPELPERPRQLEAPHYPVPRLAAPAERCAQVFQLYLHPLEPERLIWPSESCLGLRCELEHPS